MKKQMRLAAVGFLALSGIWFYLHTQSGALWPSPVLALTGAFVLYLSQFYADDAEGVTVSLPQLLAAAFSFVVVGGAVQIGISRYGSSAPDPRSPEGIRAAADAAGLHVFRVVATDNFKGSLMVVQPDGKTNQESVEGGKGWERTVTGRVVSLSFQKADQYGTLDVTIFRDGALANSGKTSADYGVVSLSAR